MSCLVAPTPIYEFHGNAACRIPDTKQQHNQTPGISWHQAAKRPRQRYPEFSDHQKRLSSYNLSWPQHHRQLPSDLAAAGFFHTGTSDTVRCYACGGALQNWEPSDNPLIEHAKWFPKCPFIKSVVGGEYDTYQPQQMCYNIAEQQISEDIPPVRIPYATHTPTGPSRHRPYETLNSTSSPEERPHYPRSATTSPVISNTVAIFSSSSAVQSVIEMGYSIDVINLAIEACKSKGSEELSATDLMNVILDIDDNPGLKQALILSTKQQQQQHNCNDRNSSTSAPTNHTVTGRARTLPKDNFQSTHGTVVRLQEENRELKDRTLCKICLDNRSSIVFLSCGHFVTCDVCSRILRHCPICRKYIQGTVKAYMV